MASFPFIPATRDHQIKTTITWLPKRWQFHTLTNNKFTSEPYLPVCMHRYTRSRMCVIKFHNTSRVKSDVGLPIEPGPGFPLKLATLVSGNRRCFFSDVTHILILQCTQNYCIQRSVGFSNCGVRVSHSLPDVSIHFHRHANCSSTLIWWFLQWIHSWFGSVVDVNYRKFAIWLRWDMAEKLKDRFDDGGDEILDRKKLKENELSDVHFFS